MKTSRPSTWHSSALMLSLAILAAGPGLNSTAHADTWTNAGSTGLWNDAANWSVNAVPADWATVNIYDAAPSGIIDLGGLSTAFLDTINFNNNQALTITHGTLIATILNAGWQQQEIAANLTSAQGYVRLETYSNTLLISGIITDSPTGPIDLYGGGNLAGANTYTGRTLVDDYDSMKISGANGSILSTSAIIVEGAALILDNTAANNDNRIAATTPFTLRFSDLQYYGANSGPSHQQLGDIALQGGLNGIQGHAGADITDPANTVTQTAALTINSLTRNLRATLTVDLDSYRVYRSSPMTIQLTHAPTLSGAGGNPATTNLSILPWAIGADGSLITVDAATGQLRPLDPYTEYATDITAAQATDNVSIASPQALKASTTINALQFGYSGQLQLSGASQLTVSSGVLSLQALGGPAISGDTGSRLHFENVEGIIHVISDSTIAVPIVATNGLTVSGSSSLHLTVPSPDLSGPLTINNAQVFSSVQGALGTGQIVIRGASYHSPGTIAFDTVNQSFANDILVDTAVDTSPNSGSYYAASLQVDKDLTVTYSGHISGRGSVDMVGPGKMIFTGHSVTGAFFFDVGGGIAQFDGLMEPDPSGGWISSYVYGRLTGTGTIRGQVIAYGGTVAPGHYHDTGILTLSALNVSNTGHLEFTLNGPTPGTDYSQILLDSQGSTYTQLTLDSNAANLDIVLGFAPTLGQTFELIDVTADRAIDGTFNNLPEGSLYTTQYQGVDYGFTVSYLGGSGNDLVLTSVPVPEPLSAALLTVGSLTLLIRRRKNASTAR